MAEIEEELSNAEFQEEEKKWRRYFTSNVVRNEIEIENYEKYRKAKIENWEIPKREWEE